MNLVIREALLAFRRAPLLSALSVTTIAFSLFVVGLFGLVAVNLQQALRDVAERLRGFGFVDDVRFGRDWVANVDRLRQIAAAVGLVVGAAFAVVAIIIIGTTIRMAVLQRSREIAIMRLVGATDGFVRRPFLLQGALKGMLGGLAAVALSYGAYALINRWLIHAEFFSREQAVAIVGFGMLIGFFGSAASVGRHLRRV